MHIHSWNTLKSQILKQMGDSLLRNIPTSQPCTPPARCYYKQAKNTLSPKKSGKYLAFQNCLLPAHNVRVPNKVSTICFSRRSHPRGKPTRRRSHDITWHLCDHVISLIHPMLARWSSASRDLRPPRKPLDNGWPFVKSGAVRCVGLCCGQVGGLAGGKQGASWGRLGLGWGQGARPSYHVHNRYSLLWHLWSFQPPNSDKPDTMVNP